MAASRTQGRTGVLRLVRALVPAAAPLDAGWWWRAACRLVPDPDALFFPEADQAAATTEALATCRRCPVRSECRAACDVEEGEAAALYGIRGGETPERRLARRARRRGAPARTAVCLQCGRAFVARRHATYCSRDCQRRGRRQRGTTRRLLPPTVRICPECGGAFPVGRHRAQRWCSLGCYHAARRTGRDTREGTG